MAEPELDTERAFLTTARAALARMYQEVEARDVPLIGGEDNDERFTNEANERAKKMRTQALLDLPDVPLFFGRIDYEAGTIEDLDQIYIGRRHVHDGSGVPLVIDWRAPVSVPFYRATRSDRQRVLMRRRYGFSDHAELTGFEDEPLIGDGRDRSGRRVPARRDRAAAHRADARHRRHDPAGAGRPGPRGTASVRLRAGCARHREDGRRPAPRGVPALHRTGAAEPRRCRDRRAEPLVPVVHPQGPARARRGRRTADHHRGADQPAGRGGGRSGGRAGQG